eukprot:gnl/MRDRNA2_/MRDRNA2_43616_c0_seq1.p1 gnl/MRDRNA2_/MRDRNA2_43616_c0~~gnl/MRDRNA2_/MRDRNA2_43616_c0_seq1.p1  ORF type:complete len:324 (+),score=65.68 gnl/MRDRNA2_/MRDRNA2_43616_c0_seq1:106-1077(+)
MSALHRLGRLLHHLDVGLEQKTPEVAPKGGLSVCSVAAEAVLDPPRSTGAIDNLSLSIAGKYSPQEWQARCDLAVAYHIARDQGWDVLFLFNHITLKVPGSEKVPGGPHFLINPFGIRFDEVTASNLLKVDLQGQVVDPGTGAGPLLTQGFVVHSSVHMARPELHAVWHCHHENTVAVSMTKDGLLPLTQEALNLYGNISYHPFEGTATDPSERDRMAKNLGASNKIMMLDNHGPLTAGATLGEAFAYMSSVTRACDYQIKALAAVGGDMKRIHLPSKEMLEQILSRGSGMDPKKNGIDTYEAMFRAAARIVEEKHGKDKIYV